MITTSEKATQKSITFPTRSVHQTSFLWALCQELVLSTTHQFVAQSAAGLPFPEISHLSTDSARRSRVRREWVTSVEVDARLLGQCSLDLGGRLLPLEAGRRRIVAGVCRGTHGTSGMPLASTAMERLMPRLPLSTGLLPRLLPSTRGLGDAAVHGHLTELQAR